jgi:phosphatidyl-myo-inositol alpha-mannosyltransferase
MRIALCHPSFWPEVLRGGERFVHGLGSTLARRGHEVTLLASHPGRTAVSEEDGMRVVRYRRPPRPPLLGYHELHVENIPALVGRLLRGRFDLIHAHFPADAYAAVLARRLGGPPVVFTLHGIVTRRHLVERRRRLEMTSTAAREAAAVTVVSEAAARAFRRYLLREPRVIPPGLFPAEFETDVARAPVPTLLCTASLGDPRKRAGLLLEAFEELRSDDGELRMVVSGSLDPIMSTERIRLPPGAEWLAPDPRPSVLAASYASAWVTVLPAIEEAFGIVLTESLAAGTPVVADRSGAGPEIIDSDSVGRLFEPDDAADLARAVRAALELASLPETAAACRRRAADFDWEKLVGQYEAVYREALGEPPDPARAGARASQK